ncbi:aminoacrylate hydrolase [Palleronia aestuarii]|uniref:Aminoacrylate hydrolase n=1 Tax=Palleronia aestuarii TaxID=568105 RepID=A0A2W7N480_9RHOB|nr:alpha/beta fold hydrolase [Palleronia aestuarii]PZX14888.1 aminoacrylate hydrolase [Palleronia aestuarii]
MSLHHEVTGTGPNVLLVSGLNGRTKFWAPVVDRLADRFTLATYDQRGCGRSPDDGAAWTIGTMAEDAAEVAKAAFGDAPYAVIGHSTGGAIAQLMAVSDRGGPHCTVLSGTLARADAYFEELLQLRLSLLDRAPDLDPILSNLLRCDPAEFSTGGTAIALDTDVTIRRIRALLGHRGYELTERWDIPALVVAAEDDRIVPPHLSRALAELIPTARFELRRDGGHFFPQTRTDWFCEIVGDWMVSLDPTARSR